jgi:hypothetical protein
MIVTDKCDTIDSKSGCYGVQSPYQTSVRNATLYLRTFIDCVKATTEYLPNAMFDAHLGAGQVLGNLSSVSIDLAGLNVKNTSVGRCLLTK